jgi:hypothetical protein
MPLRSFFYLIPLLALLASACTSAVVPAAEIPLAPIDWIRSSGGVVPMRAPVAIVDHRYAYLSYNAAGTPAWVVERVTLYPVDVFVVFTEGMDSPIVLLARAPQGDCLVSWNHEGQFFEEPCYGSRFSLEGDFWSGPSPRSLDRLPSEIRDGVIWIRAEIIYGKENP